MARTGSAARRRTSASRAGGVGDEDGGWARRERRHPARHSTRTDESAAAISPATAAFRSSRARFASRARPRGGARHRLEQERGDRLAGHAARARVGERGRERRLDDLARHRRRRRRRGRARPPRARARPSAARAAAPPASRPRPGARARSRSRPSRTPGAPRSASRSPGRRASRAPPRSRRGRGSPSAPPHTTQTGWRAISARSAETSPAPRGGSPGGEPVHAADAAGGEDADPARAPRSPPSPTRWCPRRARRARAARGRGRPPWRAARPRRRAARAPASDAPTTTAPPSTATAAGTAPAARTAAAQRRAASRPCGGGSPCATTLVSSATTGAPGGERLPRPPPRCGSGASTARVYLRRRARPPAGAACPACYKRRMLARARGWAVLVYGAVAMVVIFLGTLPVMLATRSGDLPIWFGRRVWGPLGLWLAGARVEVGAAPGRCPTGRSSSRRTTRASSTSG